MEQGKVTDFFKSWLKKLAPSFYKKLFGDGDFVQPTPYPKHSDVFIYEKDTMGELGTPVMLNVYSPEKSLISQKTIMTTTNRYACALVAVTEIVQQTAQPCGLSAFLFDLLKILDPLLREQGGNQ